jgi:hypothetical protein
MWEGRTVAILASGPSMSKEVADRVWAGAVNTIVINTTHRLAPWADMLYAADTYWWAKYAKEAGAFAGLKVTCAEGFHVPGLLVLRNTGKVGFDPDPSCVRTGGNSGYQAIHVAVHAGAKKILLCGFDMHGTHWHSRHPEPLRNAGEGIYPRWISLYEKLALELAERHVKVINCTPGSALKVWPMGNLEEALEPVCASVA